jgi:hypothetical protein
MRQTHPTTEIPSEASRPANRNAGQQRKPHKGVAQSNVPEHPSSFPSPFTKSADAPMTESAPLSKTPPVDLAHKSGAPANIGLSSGSLGGSSGSDARRTDARGGADVSRAAATAGADVSESGATEEAGATSVDVGTPGLCANVQARADVSGLAVRPAKHSVADGSRVGDGPASVVRSATNPSGLASNLPRLSVTYSGSAANPPGLGKIAQHKEPAGSRLRANRKRARRDDLEPPSFSLGIRETSEMPSFDLGIDSDEEKRENDGLGQQCRSGDEGLQGLRSRTTREGGIRGSQQQEPVQRSPGEGFDSSDRPKPPAESANHPVAKPLQTPTEPSLNKPKPAPTPLPNPLPQPAAVVSPIQTAPKPSFTTPKPSSETPCKPSSDLPSAQLKSNTTLRGPQQKSVTQTDPSSGSPLERLADTFADSDEEDRVLLSIDFRSGKKSRVSLNPSQTQEERVGMGETKQDGARDGVNEDGKVGRGRESESTFQGAKFGSLDAIWTQEEARRRSVNSSGLNIRPRMETLGGERTQWDAELAKPNGFRTAERKPSDPFRMVEQRSSDSVWAAERECLDGFRMGERTASDGIRIEERSSTEGFQTEEQMASDCFRTPPVVSQKWRRLRKSVERNPSNLLEGVRDDKAGFGGLDEQRPESGLKGLVREDLDSGTLKVPGREKKDQEVGNGVTSNGLKDAPLETTAEEGAMDDEIEDFSSPDTMERAGKTVQHHLSFLESCVLLKSAIVALNGGVASQSEKWRPGKPQSKAPSNSGEKQRAPMFLVNHIH